MQHATFSTQARLGVAGGASSQSADAGERRAPHRHDLQPATRSHEHHGRQKLCRQWQCRAPTRNRCPAPRAAEPTTTTDQGQRHLGDGFIVSPRHDLCQSQCLCQCQGAATHPRWHPRPLLTAGHPFGGRDQPQVMDAARSPLSRHWSARQAKATAHRQRSYFYELHVSDVFCGSLALRISALTTARRGRTGALSACLDH